MSLLLTTSADAITLAYKNHFVKDFADMALSQVVGESDIPEELKNSILERAIENFYTTNGIDASEVAINSMTRFVRDCAESSLEQGIEDPESREAYDTVSSQPSHMTQELDEYLNITASAYGKLLDNVVIDVVARDSHDTARLIASSAKNEISQSEAGGRIHNFNWGILSDGLWLNGALQQAFDTASIFRPGDNVNSSYITTAFGMAQKYIKTPEHKPEHEAEFSLLVDGCDRDVSERLNGDLEAFLAVKNSILTPGYLGMQIEKWSSAIKDPEKVVSSVVELSQLASTLKSMEEGWGGLLSDGLVSEDLTNRIKDVNSAVTMCLVAYEALRETKYRDTLIMYVDSKPNDAMVDVYVNEDSVHDFYQKGGEESDILPIGMYLDPKRGINKTDGGWSTSWASENKVSVLSQMIVEESDRTEKLRLNERDILERICNQSVTAVASEYALHTGMESLNPVLSGQIGMMARRVSGRDVAENFSLEKDIATVLVNTIGDPVVKDISTRFFNFSSSDNEKERQYAKELTLLETAALKTLSYIHGTVN